MPATPSKPREADKGRATTPRPDAEKGRATTPKEAEKGRVAIPKPEAEKGAAFPRTKDGEKGREALCQIEILKDGHFFIARTSTEAGQKEYKNTVFEDMLTEMVITLQEQLSEK